MAPLKNTVKFVTDIVLVELDGIVNNLLKDVILESIVIIIPLPLIVTLPPIDTDVHELEIVKFDPNDKLVVPFQPIYYSCYYYL